VTRRLDTKIAVAALSLLLLGACSSGTPGTTTTPGDSVLTSAVVAATFQSTAPGFSAPLPSGAACDPGVWTYAITLATHDVSWSGCAVNGPQTDPGSYAPATIDHPLDSTQWATVHAALAGVTVSDRNSCGADKNTEIFTVHTSSDSVTYGDDFYACQHQHASYVTSDSLDHLYATLYALP